MLDESDNKEDSQRQPSAFDQPSAFGEQVHNGKIYLSIFLYILVYSLSLSMKYNSQKLNRRNQEFNLVLLHEI